VTYQVWIWNGRYIRGKKVGRKTRSRDKAIEKAKTIKGFHHLDKEKDVLWIEDQDNNPIGLIEILESAKKDS